MVRGPTKHGQLLHPELDLGKQILGDDRPLHRCINSASTKSSVGVSGLCVLEERDPKVTSFLDDSLQEVIPFY